MHYVDTSVLTGCYCPEERSERCQRMMSSLASPAISPLVEVEFHCAVARKVRAGTLDRVLALRIFSEFQVHLSEPRFQAIAVQDRDYALAREWISQLSTSLRVLDAIHLAVSFSNGMMLVTADEALAASAKHFGVKCKFIA